MMIEITAAVHQNDIIELLQNYHQDGVSFTYKEKKGINLYFECTSDDLEKAAKLASAAIKAQSWGSVLYFRSTGVN